MTVSGTPSDLPEQVARLRRRLERERSRRFAAEAIGERVTAELYETIQQLRATQESMLERAECERLVAELTRELRQELDSDRLMQRAARSTGSATGADRCQVHLLHPAVASSDWHTAHVRLPSPTSWTNFPSPVLPGTEEARATGETVVVGDVLDDAGFDSREASAALELLGVRSWAATPMRTGNLVVGWLVVQSVEPRRWSECDLSVCEGVARELGALLLQVSAYEQQQQNVLRRDDLDRSKDAFISNVSHELRTPLTSISGYLELIEDGALGPLTDEARHAIDVIGRNAGRLRSLVEDLLTLSTYDTSGLVLDRRPVDLWRLVEDCHGALLPTLARRNLQIELRPSTGLPHVDADPTQIERVVLNLLTNAVKFTPDGGCVTVSVGHTDGTVALTVGDTGIGIPREEQDLLFSRFFRSSLSMASETQGTGLGLALTRALVEAHGGCVDLSSIEGKGTTVRVTLPVAGQPARVTSTSSALT
jgi:signal transduction histidine kinase